MYTQLYFGGSETGEIHRFTLVATRTVKSVSVSVSYNVFLKGNKYNVPQ